MLTILRLMLLVNKGISCWPFSERTYLSSIKAGQRVRSNNETKTSSPALQDLCNTNLAQVLNQDPNLWMIKDMIHDRPKQMSGEHVQAESTKVKNLWSQCANFKIFKWVALLRRWRNQGVHDEWQIVAPQTIHTCIFQACRHHKLTAHQGMVHSFDQAFVLLA